MYTESSCTVVDSSHYMRGSILYTYSNSYDFSCCFQVLVASSEKWLTFLVDAQLLCPLYRLDSLGCDISVGNYMVSEAI